MKPIIKRSIVWLVGMMSMLLLVLFLKQMFQIAIVSGHSMQPAVEDRELVLIQKQALPDRYDMIAFEQGEKVLIKRVIGVPGDSFVRSGNRLLIGDPDSNEAFSFLIQLTDDLASSMPLSGYLQEEDYFVVGDAVSNSHDSRAFGFVNQEQLLGVVATWGH